MAESEGQQGRLITANDLNEILAGLRQLPRARGRNAAPAAGTPADCDQLKRRILEGIDRLRREKEELQRQLDEARQTAGK